MNRKRAHYFLIIIGIIILGILSRQFSIIPLWIGDILYATMAYFGFRLFMVNNKIVTVAVVALIYCYSIELLQLYRAEWIVAIRNTPPGHYILGQGFSWGDLLAYTIGIGIAIFADTTKTSNLQIG